MVTNVLNISKLYQKVGILIVLLYFTKNISAENEKTGNFRKRKEIKEVFERLEYVLVRRYLELSRID